MSYLSQLTGPVAQLRDRYNLRRGQREILLARQQQLLEQLNQAEDMAAALAKVREVFYVAAEAAREQAQEYVEELVTNALQSVFGPGISFQVQVEEKRERSEAEFLVTTDYGGGFSVSNRPQDSRGGGVVDVVSLGLRTALLGATGMDGILVFDEPAKHVSDQYSTPAAELLASIAREMGRQVLMVTHNSHLAGVGETSYRIELKKGSSVAARV